MRFLKKCIRNTFLHIRKFLAISISLQICLFSTTLSIVSAQTVNIRNLDKIFRYQSIPAFTKWHDQTFQNQDSDSSVSLKTRIKCLHVWMLFTALYKQNFITVVLLWCVQWCTRPSAPRISDLVQPLSSSLISRSLTGEASHMDRERDWEVLSQPCGDQG